MIGTHTGRCPRSPAKWSMQVAEGLYHMVKMIKHMLGKKFETYASTVDDLEAKGF